LLLAAWLVQWLLQFLEWCASLPLALWQQPAPPWWSLVAATAGTIWLVAPRGVPWRVTGLALMTPAFAWPAATPAAGEAWMVTLDAGQGLAVLVRTANRALLYDAGLAFGTESDGGERIILPYLRAVGVSRLDAMVITHNDIDHSGGAGSVLQALEVDRVFSSLPASSPLHALAPGQPCVAGHAWQWDEVRFEMLHPATGAQARRSNNLSCVLKVTARSGAVLLTGDIEREAESALLQRNAGALRADVLLVPHHGSRTSSSAEFIAAVSPRVAVVPAGYRNRFGHPAEDMVGRYAAAGVVLRRTDLEGAVMARFLEKGLEIEGERERQRRYWHSAPR